MKAGATRTLAGGCTHRRPGRNYPPKYIFLQKRPLWLLLTTTRLFNLAFYNIYLYKIYLYIYYTLWAMAIL